MSDRTIEARTGLVNDRFVAHFLDAAVVPRPMTKFEWSTAAFVDPSRLHKPYGWMPPFGLDGEHPTGCACYACERGENVELILAPFCPALIAEQTAHLDDHMLEHYLDAVDYMTSLQIAYRSMAWQERERLIDLALYEAAPGSMEILNEVQMLALDGMTEA